MPQTHRPYDATFRQQAMDLAQTDWKPYRNVACNFGVSIDTLLAWRHQQAGPCCYHWQAHRVGTRQPRTQTPPRVARLFSNEASILRLVAALLVEISEEWKSGDIYLNMEPPPSPQF